MNYVTIGPMGNAETITIHSPAPEDYDFDTMSRGELVAEFSAVLKGQKKRIAKSVKEKTDAILQQVDKEKSDTEKERRDLKDLTYKLHYNLALQTIHEARQKTEAHYSRFGFHVRECPYENVRTLIARLEDAMKAVQPIR